jgi:hypothetical protein
MKRFTSPYVATPTFATPPTPINALLGLEEMAPYFGLKGRKLHALIWTQAWVSLTIFGYCSAGAGGVLNTPAFRRQFPSIDVTDAPESEKHYRSTLQGMENIALFEGNR